MFGNLFFYILGVYAFLWWFCDNFKSLFQILWTLLKSCIGENPPLNKKFGNWAVITGASDGIGKEYAKQLAMHGVNIVLIARNHAKLMQVSSEIENLYPVQTKIIVADFSDGRDIYNRIRDELSSIPVGILVNNVGTMYEYPEELAKVPEDIVWSLVAVNIGAVTMMTRLLIGDMKQLKKGIIVNVSSGVALQLYVKSFTIALQDECKPYGIEVQLLSPYFVQTKINNYSTTIMAGNIFIPDVESYTRWAVFTLGKTNETTGYWTHAIQFAVTKMYPETIRTIILFFVAKRFRNEFFAQQKQQQNQQQNRF